MLPNLRSHKEYLDFVTLDFGFKILTYMIEFLI